MSAVMELQFTRDWNGKYYQMWEGLLGPNMSERKMILELGSFEGRSACWFLQNLLDDDGWLDCVDTWEGSPEIIADGIDMWAVFERFKNNIAIAKKPSQHVEWHQKTTVSALAEFIANTPRSQCATYDLIYVDASHSANDTLTDACMAWPLLKNGGLMMFDDYTFGLNASLHLRPKFAIDAFLEIFAQELSIGLIGPQVVVKKH